MHLKLYKQLEKQTLQLDNHGDDCIAEKIRTVMDYIWRERLSSAEKNELNNRHLPVLNRDRSFEDTGFGD